MNTRWTTLSSLRVRLLMGVALLLTGTTVFTFAVDRRPIAVRATAWVASHAETLPQTLEEFAAYPADYRREILKAVSPDQKSQWWRTQLRQFAADRPNMTADQRAFVEYAIDVASPASFQPGANPPELCERIAELFPNTDERRAFTKLASAVTPTFAFRPAFLTLAERVRDKLVTRAGGDECSCRGSGLCECPLLDTCDNDTCVPIEDCGCIFVAWCNKVCNFILARPVKK